MIKATGAEITVKLLERQNVRFAAGIPGASILPIYDALSKSTIQHILVRHEQAGGFIAQGIARSSVEPAVCLATSGPGAMNLLIAIADARADSIPLVAITGQVSTGFIGTDAFQEADTFGLSLPITKHSMLISSAEELFEAVPKAFSIALSGRPGPVLIDIPVDIQKQTVTFEDWPEPGRKERKAARFRTEGRELAEKLNLFADTLLSASNPVIFAGGGCSSPESSEALQKLLEVFPCRVVSSLFGLCTLPRNNPFFIGMTGIYGSNQANEALAGADVILACGVRFDERAVGKISFEGKKLLHVDIDAAEINKLVTPYCAVTADTESVLPVITELLRQKNASKTSAAKKTDNIQKENPLSSGAELIQQFAEAAQSAGLSLNNTIITADVGLHQMWTAQGFPFSAPKQFLTSGSLGTMGFALPAAIGAALANPEKRIICFSGDGSILMNIQELATLAELNLDVTVIIFDNNSLGMVRRQQDLFYKHRHSACIFKQPSDAARIAEAFGIEAIHLSHEAVMSPERHSSWNDFAFPKAGSGPRFIQCNIPKNWN